MSDVCIEGKADIGAYIGGNIVVVLVCETLVAISLWYLWHFWKLREKKQFIYHRHPRLAAAIVLDSLPIIGILVPFASDLWSIECLANYGAIIDTPSEKAVQAVVIIAFVVFFYAWLFLVVLRVWLSRYDYEQKLATKYSFWQTDLGYTKSQNENKTSTVSGNEKGNGNQDDDDSVTNSNEVEYYQGQWWIDNKKKYGEELPMIKILSWFYIIVVVIACVASPIFWDNEGIWDFFVFWCGSCAAIICLFIVWNVWKVRRVHDNFHIRTEILYFAKVSIFIAFIMLIIFFVGRAFSSALYHYATVISGMLLNALLFSITHISTRWVISEQMRGIERRKEYLLHNLNEDIEGNTTLKTVLATKDGFEIFMDFLVSEYSTENLLCYVECTQFLRRWRHKINKKKKELDAAQTVKNDLDGAGASLASIAVVATHHIAIDQQQHKLTKPTLKDEPSTSQLEAFQENVLKPAKKKLLGNDSDSESDSENEYKMVDVEHSVVVESKHAMLNKFSFLKRPRILKDDKLEFWEHFDYLHMKYVNKKSDRQINIRSSLYKRYNKVEKEDCDFETMDYSTMPAFVLARSIDDGRATSSSNADNGIDRGSVYSAFNNRDHSPQPPPQSQLTAMDTVASVASTTATGQSDGNTTPMRTDRSDKVSLKLDDVESEMHVSLDLQKQGSNNEDEDDDDGNGNRKSPYANAPQTPSRSRRPTKNLTGIPKVLKLIDDTRKELWKLMQDSFVRFRSTDQYIQYLQNLERNKSISSKHK